MNEESVPAAEPEPPAWRRKAPARKWTVVIVAALCSLLTAALLAPVAFGEESESAAADPDQSKMMRHRGGPGGLQEAAEAIGISSEELFDALRSGQSIAQVAQDNGVDPETVVDAMVARGTERLEEAIERLPEMVRSRVEREGVPTRPGFRKGPGMRMHPQEPAGEPGA